MVDNAKQLAKTTLNKEKLQLKLDKELQKHITSLVRTFAKKPKNYDQICELASQIESKSRALSNSL